MKVLHVVGARPNYMKVAPIMAEMGSHPHEFQQVLVHTGQHYDRNMSDCFFQQLAMPEPDEFLGIGSGTHAQQTARVMLAFEPVLAKHRPDWVFVVGDVNSTLACALVCAKLGIPVAHVEAGLRSHDMTMPEEINRLLTDQIADLLFTPSRDGNENLRREGVSADKVHFVGNVMIDSLTRMLPAAQSLDLLSDFGLCPRKYVLATFHRPSNVDDPVKLRELLSALKAIAREVSVVFPVHPRTRQRIASLGAYSCDNGLRFLEPLGYLEFLALMNSAALVLTDSGGVQEETTFLGVPCLTVRPSTERPITISEGTNRLVPDNCAAIASAFAEAISAPAGNGKHPELWDGRAADRIVRVMLNIERRPERLPHCSSIRTSVGPAMSSAGGTLVPAENPQPAARLLYVCDFPPSNLAGGPILMSRLLQDYPSDQVVVLTSSRYSRVSPQEGRLACDHLVFPTTRGWGRWGLGWVKNLIDWLMVPILALFCAWVIRHRRVRFMVSVAHDRFFIGAAIASWLTSVPLILAVHDDWVQTQQQRARLLEPYFRALFRFAIRRAAHIYSVSVGMQEFVKTTCGRESELQLPAIAPYSSEAFVDALQPGVTREPIRIVYAGGIVENAESLVRLIKSGSLERYGLQTCSLDLYVPLTKEHFLELGWAHALINLRGWVSHSELQRALCNADILFLPASFVKEQEPVVIAGFPAKTSDYLASGRPILVFGPEYSSLVRYARQYGFAEVVTEPTDDALAKGIRNIVSSPSHSKELVYRASSTLSANHDIFKQRQNFHQLVAELAL